VPVALRGEGVGGDEQSDRRRPVWVAGRVVHQAVRGGGKEHGHRPAAPEQQDQAAHDQQQVAEAVGVAERPDPRLVLGRAAGPQKLESATETASTASCACTGRRSRAATGPMGSS
jgi:hypothetical protein